MSRLAWFVSKILLIITFAEASSQTQTITYHPSDAIFPNPERGFYAHRETQAEGTALSLADLKIQRSANRTLILRMYYLKSFRSKDLSATQLDLIQKDFDIMREAGVKCILRFAYSQDIGQPDAPRDIILRHLDQLQALLQAHHDVIAVMQAGFIGAWGEWHSSTNGLDNNNDRRAILSKILEVLPKHRMVQVRTPLFKQQILSTNQPLTETQAFTGTDLARTGHHNDCFLASWDDYGTYQDTLREKSYLSLDTRFVPMGGETCSPSSFSGCRNALQELARMRWSYLNRNYHLTVLNGFINGGCMDEIERRLGYRFSLQRAEFTAAAKSGSAFTLKIELTNTGWASPYNPRDVEIVLRNQSDSSRYYAKLPGDPRFWLAGDTVMVAATIGIPPTMPNGEYAALLNLPDPAPALHFRPEYSIHLANEDVWEPETGYNHLLGHVTIDTNASGEPYTGTLMFQPLDISSGIDEAGAGSPASTKLLGNYPNPFNPLTTIKYQLAEPAHVLLKVFDLSGADVKTLVFDKQSAGLHQIIFDGSNLPSGVYYYRLQAGSYTETRKMTLVK